MMNWIFTTGLARRVFPATLAVVLAFPISAFAQPAATVPSISADALMTSLRTLTSAPFAGRGTGSEGGALARQWVRERFEAAGLQAPSGGFEQPFEFTPRRGGSDAKPMTGVNVVGICPGSDARRPAIVVSAHYDHLGVRDGRMYPGADDNASGVAVIVELAALCVRYPFRHTLVFAAFDAEELGLQGARAFVEKLPVERGRLAMNVNLDMVARGDKGELYAAGLYHYPGFRPLLNPVASRAPIRLLFGHDVPGTGSNDWTMQSDHGVFHTAGVPFVYFGVEDHPDYHQPTDTADRVNPVFFAQSANVILDALRALDLW